jgi:predicted double-glycine peptidase
MKKIITVIQSIIIATALYSCSAKELPQTEITNISTLGTAKNIDKNVIRKSTAKLHVKDLPANFMFLPVTRQATDYTCGASALQSVMRYYGDEYMEKELADTLKSDPNEGTGYHNIADFSQAQGYRVNIYKNMKFTDLKKLINGKKPVMVLLQAWSDEQTDYKNDWEDGHYAVVIGYDDKNVYFMDPSTLGNYTFIPVQQFLDRWHDTDGTEKLYNFGIVVEKLPVKYNPDDVLMME